jgi:hypothetical membrane protein
VHDANAVEVLGAFGIAKAFTTGGARGQSNEQTVELLGSARQAPVGSALWSSRRHRVGRLLEAPREEVVVRHTRHSVEGAAGRLRAAATHLQDTHCQQRRAVAAALVVAGIAGLTLFTLSFVVQDLLRPDYSPVADPISALGIGPSGWVQNLTFIVLGPLIGAYALGLHLGMRPARAGLLGPALLTLAGVGSVLLGVVPLQAVAGGGISEPAGHTVASFLVFLGTGLGLIALSQRMAADPWWRSLAVYALATGVALVVGFLAVGGLAATPGAPLYRWFGLAQRALLAVWYPCMITLALRLLRLARTTGGPRPGGRRV